MEEVRKLMEDLVRALVDKPEAVSIDLLQGEQTSVLQVRVDKSDLGKVIGKQGKNAQAIRTMLIAITTKMRKRAVLEIIEE